LRRFQPTYPKISEKPLPFLPSQSNINEFNILDLSKNRSIVGLDKL